MSEPGQRGIHMDVQNPPHILFSLICIEEVSAIRDRGSMQGANQINVNVLVGHFSAGSAPKSVLSLVSRPARLQNNVTYRYKYVKRTRRAKWGQTGKQGLVARKESR